MLIRIVQPRKLSGLVPGSSPGRPNFLMAWVYILRGAAGRYYIGSTENLQRRLTEHRRGSNRTTHRFGGKVELIAAKEFASMAGARKFEKELKRKKNPRLAIFALQSRC